jgi:regulator of RNase E activity RraA
MQQPDFVSNLASPEEREALRQRYLLVDGGIREVRWIGEHGFPVFDRYRIPVQSIGRWKVNAYKVPVVIPQEHVVSVLVEAERLTSVESNIRIELANGLTLAQALQKFGHN